MPGILASAYAIDAVNATLTWISPPPLDSVLIRYRVFHERLNASAQRMRYDSVMNNFIGQPYIPDFGRRDDDRFFNFGTLNYSGSFGRGISFGNAQDVVVSSNLNLQLNGFLADSIEILAAITDNNIPIQPDGTTQQLNEFDRIFLQFRKSGWQLSLGDIDIRQDESYFLNFYKRLQGIAFENRSALSEKIVNRSILSGSIAKGKFTRNIIQGQEGNQGPYRLTGANNEFFFVVLANTERVFIDGELLQRGEDQDYVINYNTAEIAFTPRRMITKDSRIQVEFEYSDRNYLNANLFASNAVTINEKLTLRVSAFNNSDAKSSPINQNLDSRQKSFLDSLGDDINRAFFPNAVRDTFSTGAILYKRVDTVFNGSRDSIYIFSTHPDSARYSLSFLDVGQGNGNYVPELNAANGKVYRWIAPLNGMPQGRFEPALFLVTPKKQQVVSVGADYVVTDKTSIQTEVAMSNYDVNTFSKKDKENNRGFAAKVGMKHAVPVSGESRGYRLISTLGYEYVEKEFRPLERLRNVEYTRDWGLPLVVAPADERILTAGLRLEDKRQNALQYQLTHFSRDKLFNGLRNTLIHTQDIKGYKFNNIINLSSISTDTEKGYFLRPSFAVSRKFEKLRDYQLALQYSVEHNELRDKETDSVSPRAFSFSIAQASLKSSTDKPNRWGLIFFTRTDAYPSGKLLQRSDRSRNINLFTELLKNPRHQFRLNTTFRSLEILQGGISNAEPENSLLSRAEYQVNEWKGFLTGNILYEVGAGQEQKRDYSFLEVPAGQGEYTWIDYDNNSIQSLNEFELAQFQDQARYIRIFTPTNEFIKANYNTLNYSVALNPKAIIRNESKTLALDLLQRINLQSSLQINKKEIARGLVQFNPFSSPLSDTSLITLSSVFINTLSFNRFSSKWGFDVNSSMNGNRALLTYGYESRELRQLGVKGRWNITRELLIDLALRKGNNTLVTSNAKFDNRNYDINTRALEPRITLTRKSNFRMMTGYVYSEKKNSGGNQEEALSHAVQTEVKYNMLQSASILGRFTYNSINFSSRDSIPNPNTTSSYIILDGLMPGKNFLWNLDLTKRLSGNLELNIQYEGRKPGTGRVIHTGRASVRAIL